MTKTLYQLSGLTQNNIAGGGDLLHGELDDFTPHTGMTPFTK